MTKIFETPLYPYQRSPDQEPGAKARHPVVIIGAGPIGLAAAIDLAQQDIPVVVLDDNDRVSFGSRAICFAKRPLEILDRLGCGEPMVDKGVLWDTGKVFFDEAETYRFNLLSETGHKNPAFINLQQYYFEEYLIKRLRELQAEGKPVDLRGESKVTALADNGDHVRLEVDTPEGPYLLEADWLIAADGAASASRRMLGHDFKGRVFEDNFLIADVIMEADFPSERWFWFDPPFNRGQSALLHKQPDNVWRIDLQLGWDIDKDEEKKPVHLTRNDRYVLKQLIELGIFVKKHRGKFRHCCLIVLLEYTHDFCQFKRKGNDFEQIAWFAHRKHCLEHLVDLGIIPCKSFLF